jgi:thioredoxin-like negative regulator of GroEL
VNKFHAVILFSAVIALSGCVLKKEAPKPSLLVFSSADCKACAEFKPIADEIASEYKGKVKVKIYEISRTPGSDYAASYGVKSTPTVIFLDSAGSQYFRLDRAASKDLIKALLDAKLE